MRVEALLPTRIVVAKRQQFVLLFVGRLEHASPSWCVTLMLERILSHLRQLLEHQM